MSRRRIQRTSLVMGPLRDRATMTLVGALTGCYGAMMVCGADVLGALARSSGGGGIGRMLSAVSTVFVGIALYVGGIVIAGCVATVIAGRLKHIATLRLLGSTSSVLRTWVGRACAVSAGLGAIIGAALGLGLSLAVREVLIRRGSLPDLDYSTAPWPIAVVILAVVAMAYLAGRAGSRKVLTVAPAAAFTGIVDTTAGSARRVRLVMAVLLTLGGAAALTFGALVGEREGETMGFGLAFLGGITLMSGIIAGAPWYVPALVRMTSALAGRATPARIARRNAVADPMRTARSTVGLIVGVTLVVTFMSGAASLTDSVNSWNDLGAEQRTIAVQVLDLTGKLLTAIVVVSSIIAAVGFVSTMSLVVLQRRREIGLLRALGLTTREVRRMVTVESLALGVTAVLFGIALGTLFGTVGAQSLIGYLNDGLVLGLPWATLALVTACAFVLVLVAALPPARRSNRVSVVEALHM